VKYEDPALAREVREDVPATVVKRLRSESLEVIDPAGSIEVALAELQDHPDVAYAEPNYLYEASAVTPNDPRFGSLWAMEKIGMPEAWAVSTGSRDVTVAVVDSGIALQHPDLAPNVWTNPGESGAGKETNGADDDGNGYVDDWRGWDWVDRDNRPGDAHGHGSHVAGTIAARGNDAYGVAGVNWDASLVALRGLDHTGTGTSADIAAAFHYAGKQGIDVVNASFGGTGQSVAILEAITAYPETLFVVAAGNEGSNNDVAPQYPCSYRIANLMCVAASDQDDNLAGFSNYGAVSVDLAAPGVGILSTAPAFSIPLSESFDSDITSRWTTGGTNNLWGRALDLEGGYFADSPATDYLPDTDAWAATSQPFSLAGQEDCKLSYDLRLSTEGGKDALIIEASRDAKSWTKIEAWSGNSEGKWRRMNESLHAFDGSPEVFLRFRLRSDGSVNDQGADIDNVRGHCQSQTYSGQEFRSASGTSMAAPHVAGVAALLKAVEPSATVSQITAAILSGSETVPALAGKVATSGRLSATGALEALGVQIVEEEPAPDPVPGGGVEASHERTITLRLVRSLQARGRLTSDHSPCVAEVRIVIRRNGRKIATARTDDQGLYKVRLRDRRGRYVAHAPRLETSEVPAATCLAARSSVAKH
jgi:subtilisin family serine protease